MTTQENVCPLLQNSKCNLDTFTAYSQHHDSFREILTLSISLGAIKDHVKKIITTVYQLSLAQRDQLPSLTELIRWMGAKHQQALGGSAWERRVMHFTLMQTPVVASHSVRMELFWALFSQLTANLVLVAHFTMVI